MHHTVGYKLDGVYYNLKEGLHTTRRRSIVRDERGRCPTIKYSMQGLYGDNYKFTTQLPSQAMSAGGSARSSQEGDKNKLPRPGTWRRAPLRHSTNRARQ